MELQLVSKNVAILAKELGFDWECYNSYDLRTDTIESAFFSLADSITFNKEDIEEADSNDYPSILLPTQELLAKWLRDVYKMHITITSISQESWQYHVTEIGQKLGDDYDEDYSNYEDAMEDGLKIALSRIKRTIETDSK